jgi:hypothetical protein
VLVEEDAAVAGVRDAFARGVVEGDVEAVLGVEARGWGGSWSWGEGGWVAGGVLDPFGGEVDGGWGPVFGGF